MKLRLPPIQISTREAFEGILEEDAMAMYITANVFLEMHSTIRQQLRDHGFEEWMVTRRGIIYVKTLGPHKYDPGRHRIFLPIEGIE